jgi:hypothetical protein
MHGGEHRLGLKISGKNQSCEIIGTDPLVDNRKKLSPAPAKGFEND